MEKRIELEKRNRPLDQIGELNLDNCRSTTIEGLTDDFVNLKTLSLNGVGLTSLKGFPSLPNLRKLEMGDNRIAGGLQVLKDCPKLTVLNMSNNKIKDLDSLVALKELAALESLDLVGNDVTQIEDYRTKIFDLLPGLTYLDATDRNGKEIDESDLDDDEPPVNGKATEAEDLSVGGKTGNGAGESSPEGFSAADGDGDIDLGANEDVESYGSSSDEEDDGDDSTVGLKDIYREDLDKESDGGDYEEEEDSDEDSEDEVEYDTSQAEDPEDNAEVAGVEVDGDVGEEEEGDEDEDEDEEDELEGDDIGEAPRRGVKRQHESEGVDDSD